MNKLIHLIYLLIDFRQITAISYDYFIIKSIFEHITLKLF